MKTEDLFSLLDNLSKSNKLQDTTDQLRSALTELGLDHISYLAVNIPTQKTALPLLAVTYAPEWQRHYYQNNYVDIDPVVKAGLGGLLPIDWAQVDRSQRVVQRFFSEAQDFDIGQQGLSFPIRGRMNEFALFSVTSDVSDVEWPCSMRGWKPPITGPCCRSGRRSACAGVPRANRIGISARS